MVYSDPNNTNSMAYQYTLLGYWLKTSHWNISWAVTLHLYNMADRGEKLQKPHCYHPFSDSRATYLTKNHYENYSPKMVPTNPTGSWTIVPFARQHFGDNCCYQHDNTRPHHARVVLDFLHHGNISKMEQPARSPDCNPMEHIWAVQSPVWTTRPRILESPVKLCWINGQKAL